MRIVDDLARGVDRRRSEDKEFHDFATAFSSTLLRAAFLLLRDRHAAEDAVQATLLNTFRRWRQARAAPEAFSRQVLLNVCRDQWRHQRRHPLGELTADPVEPVTTAPWQPDDRLALADALGELTAQQREVLVLRFFLDLSVSQTAELLGIAEGTVKSTAHRGLDALRGRLNHTFQETRT